MSESDSNSDTKRVVCPKCGNKDHRKLHDEEDKGEILYYSMQGTPVFKRIMKCGECGHKWKKE